MKHCLEVCKWLFIFIHTPRKISAYGFCACTHFLFPSSSFKAPLVHSSDGGHSSTAVIMLVSVVLMGLAVFVIYKFKRYSTLYTVCRWSQSVGEIRYVWTLVLGISCHWGGCCCCCRVFVCFCITAPFRPVAIIYSTSQRLIGELLKVSGSIQTPYITGLWSSASQ